MISRWLWNFRKAVAGSSGFTLIEVVIATTILSLTVGMIGSGIFQLLAVQRFWIDDVATTRELRHVNSWFAGDALNAEDVLDDTGTTQLTCNPSPAVRQVTLTWDDTQGTSHTANYAVSGGNLVRTEDGTGFELARRVVASSLSFSLCSNLLTLVMDAEVKPGEVETVTLRTYLRKMP